MDDLPVAIMYIAAGSFYNKEVPSNFVDVMKKTTPPFIEVSHQASSIINEHMSMTPEGSPSFYVINLSETDEEYHLDTISNKEVVDFLHFIRKIREAYDFDIGVWIVYEEFTKRAVCEAYDIPI